VDRKKLHSLHCDFECRFCSDGKGRPWCGPGLTPFSPQAVLAAGEPGSDMLVNSLYDIDLVVADDGFFRKCVLLIDRTSRFPGCKERLTRYI